jgi:hypothetical protein
MTEYLKPDMNDISYGEDKIRKAAKKPQVPFGVHRFIVLEASSGVAQNGKIAGCLQLKLRVAALQNVKDPESGIRPHMFENVTLPLDNPSVDGHCAPEWTSGIASQALHALYDEAELPRMPTRVDGQLIYNGEEIERDQEDEYREDCMSKLFEKCKELFGDPSDLRDRTFIGEVGLDKTGQFVNILNKWNDADERPADKDFYSWDVEEVAPAPKAAVKKAAPVVAKKKK